MLSMIQLHLEKIKLIKLKQRIQNQQNTTETNETNIKYVSLTTQISGSGGWREEG